MMTIDELMDERPHLRDALTLFEKVCSFKEILSGIEKIPAGPGTISYPVQVTGTIFERFSSLFDIPMEHLGSLKEAMESGQIDLSRLPLNETPSFTLPYHEDEVMNILFLLGKPYFLSLRNDCATEHTFWEEGKCPVCKSAPSLASIKKDEGRMLHCSYCENSGHWHRIGCPNCQNQNVDTLDIIMVENEEGFRINLCRECAGYIKTFDKSLLIDHTIGLLDILSLHLDVIAQERGYSRFSPNHIGMIRMI